MTYTCLHCSRTFATPYALKRHISDKHKYDTDDDEGETSRLNLPYEEPGLWDDDLPTNEPGLWDDDLPTNEPGLWDDDLPTEEPILDDLPIEVRP
jgi:hypothetical protein